MLSKSDKNKYRSLLFRHLDGISLLGPISLLNKSKIVELINTSDSFTLEDINSFKKCNLGYMNVTMHLLICQGWVNQNNSIYSKTENGKIAFDHFYFYEKIYPYINNLIKCNYQLIQN